MNTESETPDNENSGNQTGETGDCGAPEEIAQCAYHIWEQEGRPEGRALEHWCRAELEIRTGTTSATPAS